MKKYVMILLMLSLLLMPACNKSNDKIGGADGPTNIWVKSGHENSERSIARIIRVNGEYYYDTGMESTMGPRCGVMDGSVIVDPALSSPYELPRNDFESNFGVIDQTYGYQLGSEKNTLELLDNGTWWVYRKVVTDSDLSSYRYVYILSGNLENEETEKQWLIFSDDLELRVDQVKETLAHSESGEKSDFFFVLL